MVLRTHAAGRGPKPSAIAGSVINLDPQASAKRWHDHRQKESPVVISTQASSIKTTCSKHGDYPRRQFHIARALRAHRLGPPPRNDEG